jgi:acetolactate synthase-1/2/3 large subunit
MTGAEYIAEFLHRKKLNNIFLVTGGAIAFVVDAIGIKNKAKYFCFNHEQSAAMAADSVWRATNGKDIGVCMATSGPGAVNLLSGLGCSYVDSIPSIAITGQVNSIESLKYGNYKDLRQAGYQEIDIVKMSKNVTKFSVKIESAFGLKYNLEKAYQIATSGRKGPVLIDVPMNIQQEEVGNFENFNLNYQKESSELFSFKELNLLKNFFLNTKRP